METWRAAAENMERDFQVYLRGALAGEARASLAAVGLSRADDFDGLRDLSPVELAEFYSDVAAARGRTAEPQELEAFCGLVHASGPRRSGCAGSWPGRQWSSPLTGARGPRPLQRR